MNNAADILSRCQRDGIILALAADGGLDITPQACVTADLHDDIRINFREIVRILQGEGMNWLPRVQATRQQLMEVERPEVPVEIIKRCERAGISLSANGDQLQITRSRKTAFPHELRNALVENKQGIMVLLAADSVDADANNARRKTLSLHWLDT